MMDVQEAIEKRRTVRFFQQKNIDDAALMSLVDAACLAPSAGNRQVLRYKIVRTPELRDRLFQETAWAGYITPKRTPVPGINGPAAFLAVLAQPDENGVVSPMVMADSGAAVEAVLLRGMPLGIGGCWIGAFQHENVERLLNAAPLKVLFLVALGYPAESPVLERIVPGDSIRYYLDGNGVLHVPKHKAESVTELL